MRTLFAGALAATVVGCSCYVSPQAGLDTCVGGSGLACLDRSSVNQTIEPEPAASDTNRSARKAGSRSATRREQPVSAHARHEADLAKNAATSTAPATKVEQAAAKVEPAAAKAEPSAAKAEPSAAKAEPSAAKAEPSVAKAEPAASKADPPASGRPAETSDQIIAKAKATIASRLEDPKSAEFGEMKRAMRTNTLGKSVDTICGYVRSKKMSGEGTGDRPFLYLVKDDEAYVVDGPPTSIAATAYRNICK
jgi:hypothetical protein